MIPSDPDTVASIYGLMSSRNQKIRYIGQTARDAEKRFDEHYLHSKAQSPLGIWRRQELWLGYDIVRIELEKCPETEAGERETYWIDRIPDLLNKNKNHPNEKILPTEREKAFLDRVIDEWSPEFTDNWKGYVSIRYEPEVLNHWHVNKWGEQVVTHISEAWRPRVYDPFGQAWGISIGVTELSLALKYRSEAREQAAEYQRKKFGFSLEWPRDNNL